MTGTWPIAAQPLPGTEGPPLHSVDHVRSLVDVICSRRSVRGGFVGAALPEAVVDEIVRCGLSAPSSKNAQPWCLHVVTNRRLLSEIADAVQGASDANTYVPVDPLTGLPHPEWVSTVVESAEVLRQVPVGIFVENLGEFSKGRAAISRATLENRDAALVGFVFEVVGLGASIENMWLAAHANAVSGVFMGDVLTAEQMIRERLQMSGDLVGVLALGYSTAAPRFERFHAPGRLVRHP